MRFATVCSGIEAPSVAWDPLGWEPVFFSEIDPFANHVLNQRHGAGRPQFLIDPETLPVGSDERELATKHRELNAMVPETGDLPNYGDMTFYEEWPDHGPIDILFGGTPCQSFSLAGNRGGLDDPRGNLMLTYGAIARRYRPRWLGWENVTGVLSSNGGADFASLLGLLTGRRITVPAGGFRSAGVVPSIANAYGVAWRVLDTQFVRVDGFERAVPQRRRRVFVIGYSGDWRPAAAVFFERHGIERHPEPVRTAGQDIARDVAPSIVSGGCGTMRIGESRGQDPVVAVRMRGFGDYVEDGTASTMKARDYKDNTDLIAFNARQDPVPSGDVAGALDTARPQAQAVAFDMQQITSPDNRSQPKPVAPTMSARGTLHAVDEDWQVRRLMPIECERLQGYPDDYTRISWRNKPVSKCPDTPRYETLGNSMSVNVVRWIGRRIEMVETILKEKTPC